MLTRSQSGRITWNVNDLNLNLKSGVKILKDLIFEIRSHRLSRDATVMACLLKNEPTSLCMLLAKPFSGQALGKPSVNSANHISSTHKTRSQMSLP